MFNKSFLADSVYYIHVQCIFLVCGYNEKHLLAVSRSETEPETKGWKIEFFNHTASHAYGYM